jgi:hypothetical protein
VEVLPQLLRTESVSNSSPHRGELKRRRCKMKKKKLNSPDPMEKTFTTYTMTCRGVPLLIPCHTINTQRDNATRRKELPQKSSRKIRKKLGVRIRTHDFALKASTNFLKIFGAVILGKMFYHDLQGGWRPLNHQHNATTRQQQKIFYCFLA